MEEKQSALSHNIKYLRKSKGLNQEQLAQALNIKRSNIAAYEAKNVEPRLRVILEMAKFFNINLQSFLETKMNDTSKKEVFGSSTTPSLNKHNKIKDSINITAFVEKSIKIRKILIGFKTFHAFRRSKMTKIEPEQAKILGDIDNFIMLMEHLLLHNETMVKALSAQRKV